MKAAGKGPKIGAKQPVSENMIFRLHWAAFWERFALAEGNELLRFAGSTARHWRALLFVGFAISENQQARRGNRAAWNELWNRLPIRVEPIIQSVSRRMLAAAALRSVRATIRPPFDQQLRVSHRTQAKVSEVRPDRTAN
jgi:hypothetical protein